MSSPTTSEIHFSNVELDLKVRFNNNAQGKTSSVDFSITRNPDFLGLKLISKTIKQGDVNQLEFYVELCTPISSNCQEIINESYEVPSTFPEETFNITIVNPLFSPPSVLMKTKIKTNSKVLVKELISK